METHAHELHKTPGRGLKHYFFEFFMLFLAVFCGFIAENIRERMVEAKRGEEYVKSFIEDLRKDTAQYSRLIIQLTYQDSMTDNISSCYDSVSRNVKSTACLENMTRNLIWFSDFIYTDRAMQQLKNAGGLRLIKDKIAADSIIDYDASVRRELIHQESLEIYQQKSIDAAKAIIDFRSFRKFVSKSASLDDPKSADCQLLQTSKTAIDNYFNTLWIFKGNLRRQINMLQYLKENAIRLISFLENK